MDLKIRKIWLTHLAYSKLRLINRNKKSTVCIENVKIAYFRLHEVEKNSNVANING